MIPANWFYNLIFLLSYLQYTFGTRYTHCTPGTVRACKIFTLRYILSAALTGLYSCITNPFQAPSFDHKLFSLVNTASAVCVLIWINIWSCITFRNKYSRYVKDSIVFRLKFLKQNVLKCMKWPFIDLIPYLILRRFPSET